MVLRNLCRSEEDFSYFTLLRPETETKPATSLFGISCTRQLDSSQLINRPADVTRSTVQKAVVVIADSPQFFGMLRERLSIVTQAWFAQREFTDVEILRRFQESLADEKSKGILNDQVDRDQYLGMSLRELIHEYKWQTLVLLKCCLLQPKVTLLVFPTVTKIADRYFQMLFFGSRCDRLCMMQFSLLSLIPGLIRNLQDSADPELNSYETSLSKPTSLRTSDRNSLLCYMGLPLQIFGKVSLVTTRSKQELIANREACLDPIPLCNNLIFSPTLAQSPILSAVQTHFSCSRRIATVIFSSIWTRTQLSSILRHSEAL